MQLVKGFDGALNIRVLNARVALELVGHWRQLRGIGKTKRMKMGLGSGGYSESIAMS